MHKNVVSLGIEQNEARIHHIHVELVSKMFVVFHYITYTPVHINHANLRLDVHCKRKGGSIPTTACFLVPMRTTASNGDCDAHMVHVHAS